MVEIEYTYFDRIISSAVNAKDYVSAQKAAMQWAAIVERKLGLSSASNWKQFKVLLSESYFGKPEQRFFCSKSSVDELLRYYYSINASNVRVSVLHSNKACHSYSRRINDASILDVVQELHTLSDGDILKMFPESSNNNTICFRRLLDWDYHTAFYEVGFGQASVTFENERGKHDTVAIRVDGNIQIVNSQNKHLAVLGEKLIQNWDTYLDINSWRLCKYLGLPYVSIEGYYDYRNNLTPIVVDLDLPFDKSFFGGTK